MIHKLNVYLDVRPVKQKKRMFEAEKREAMMLEVDNLIEARFVMEIPYPKWLVNPVLVKKKIQQ